MNSTLLMDNDIDSDIQKRDLVTGLSPLFLKEERSSLRPLSPREAYRRPPKDSMTSYSCKAAGRCL